MDARIVPEPQHEPRVCLICKRSAGDGVGPFVDTRVEPLTVATPDGPAEVEARLYICVGNPDRPGCLIDMLHAVPGGVSPWDHEAALIGRDAVVEDLGRQLAAVRAELKARDSLVLVSAADASAAGLVPTVIPGQLDITGSATDPSA